MTIKQIGKLSIYIQQRSNLKKVHFDDTCKYKFTNIPVYKNKKFYRFNLTVPEYHSYTNRNILSRFDERFYKHIKMLGWSLHVLKVNEVLELS